MKFVKTIDAMMAAAAPAPWTSGHDPCHFDAPEVRNSKWAIYVPTDQDARLIAALHSAWPAIRRVLLAVNEERSPSSRTDNALEKLLTDGFWRNAGGQESEARSDLILALDELENQDV